MRIVGLVSLALGLLYGPTRVMILRIPCTFVLLVLAFSLELLEWLGWISEARCLTIVEWYVTHLPIMPMPPQ